MVAAPDRVTSSSSSSSSESTSELTSEQLATLKRALLRKGRALAEQLAELMSGKSVRLDDAAFGEPAVVGETPRERVRRHLDLVDGRIKAIGAGAYGRCLLCASPLSYVELEQLPWAEYCRPCASKTAAK